MSGLDVRSAREFVDGKRFSLFIQLLILVSLISFTLETVPDLPPEAYEVLSLIELITVIIFSAEYILRLMIAESKWQFIFSFYGIIDLLAILPFYVATGVDLRSLRALRFFRTIRLLKIVRYSRALQNFQRAFTLVREELLIFLLTTVFVLYFSAAGIYHFEHTAQPEVFTSVHHSMWWAVATLTTVGYGDVYPITAGGKVFTFFVFDLDPKKWKCS